MKRHLVKLAVVAIAAMLALVALAGCNGQKQDAIDALKTASENLKAADSVEMNADITVKVKAEGIPISIKGNVDVQYAYDNDLSKLLDSEFLYKMNIGVMGQTVDLGVYYTDHKLYLSVTTPDGTEQIYYTLSGETADLIATYLSENGEDLQAELDNLGLPDVYDYFTRGKIEDGAYVLEFDAIKYASDLMSKAAEKSESTDISESMQAMQALNSMIKGEKPRITFTIDSAGNFETFEFLWDMEIDGSSLGTTESIPVSVIYAINSFKTGDVKFNWPDFSGFKNQGDLFDQFVDSSDGGLDFDVEDYDGIDDLDDILPVAFRDGKAA